MKLETKQLQADELMREIKGLISSLEASNVAHSMVMQICESEHRKRSMEAAIEIANKQWEHKKIRDEIKWFPFIEYCRTGKFKGC